MMRPKRAFVAPPRPDASKSAHPVVLESAPELGWKEPPNYRSCQDSGFPLRRPRGASPRHPEGVHRGRRAGDGGAPLDIPPQLSATSNLSAAIVGLRPSERIEGPIPPGSRPGEFSAAPNVGKTSTGDVNGAGGAAVPGLMIKDGKSERANSRGNAPPDRGPLFMTIWCRVPFVPRCPLRCGRLPAPFRKPWKRASGEGSSTRS